MLQGVDQVDIEHARDVLIEDNEPIIPGLPVLRRQTVGIYVTKSIGLGMVRLLANPSVIRGGMGGHLRRLAGSRVRNRRVDLRSGRAAGRRSADAAPLARARGGSALRWL